MIDLERKNRRRFHRAPIDVPVQEHCADDQMLAHTEDISEWGLRYCRLTGSPERKGREVFLEFKLPRDPRPIRASGWVTNERHRSLTHSTSVRFTSIRPYDAGRIRDYVTDLAKAA